MEWKIWFIIIANILWALIPVPAVQLFVTYSVFIVFLLRFFFSGVIILFFSLILAVAYKRKHPDFSLKVFYQYIRSPNQDYRNMSQLSYIAILGSIGITFQIVFYFFSFKFLGVIVTVIGFPLSLILVTFFSRETMDFFKGVYLGVLVIAAILVGVGRFDVAADQLMNPAGWLSLIIFTLSMTFLMNQMVKDPLNPWETELVIKTNNFYRILRTLIKVGVLFLISCVFIFPIAGLFTLFPPDSGFQQDAVLFWTQLNQLWPLFISPQGLFLIFGATVVPWSLLFIAEAYWPRSNLPFDTWSSILAILEPIGSIIFGVLIIGEQFPIEFLFIVMVLLGLSILLRYVHETSDKVLAYVGLKLVPQQEKQVFQELFHMKNVETIYSVVGDFDLILFIRAMNVVEFNRMVREQEDESIPDEVPIAEETASDTLEQEFLGELERFKAWISSRSYLQGDLDTAGTMVTSLATIFAKIRSPLSEVESDLQAKLKKISTAELYKKVPPEFLPAGVRKALYRLIKGKLEKNDYYHLKKLQEAAESAAKTHQIYQVILELIDRAKFKAKLSKKKVNPNT